jgi:hypothetical protein
MSCNGSNDTGTKRPACTDVYCWLAEPHSGQAEELRVHGTMLLAVDRFLREQTYWQVHLYTLPRTRLRNEKVLDVQW